MIEINDIEIDDTRFSMRMEANGFITSRLLLDAVDDIAQRVKSVAEDRAPMGKGENPRDRPGTLKEFGVIKKDAERHFVSGEFGSPGAFVDPTAPAIGGGFSVRGGNPLNKGQFSKRPSGGFENLPGHVFSGEGSRTIVTASVELNPAVPHAKWVHEGTGIFGPRHTPIVPVRAKYLRFRWRGKKRAMKSVRGQPAQPFLTEAYAYVNNVYANARVSELRAELAAVN
jgi:hypothetical protein